MTKKRGAAKRSASARKPQSPAKRSTRKAMSVAANTRRTVDERVTAMAEVPLAVCESDENLQTMLAPSFGTRTSP